jgi:hypothetical protein
MGSLSSGLEAYSAWRAGLIVSVVRYRGWLAENELDDAQTELRIARLIERLAEDRLVIAFVAALARGKSELINAIFFAGVGAPLLPSGEGRATLCPTELLYDKSRPPSIELLPIETGASCTSASEFRRYPDEWRVLPLDTSSLDAIMAGLSSIGETKRVQLDEARRCGLYDRLGRDHGLVAHEDGSVEIPRWRHAFVNMPHPLLEHGLVILDTPGLNATGKEPETMSSPLPNVHAIVFVIAADSGITNSDLAVWRDHAGQPAQTAPGRFAVLNKIDGLWDPRKSTEDIDADIAAQAECCARALGLPSMRMYAVSAQKGLLAKLTGDRPLLERSRLPELERAIAAEVIPSRHQIMASLARTEIEDLLATMRSRLDAQRRSVLDQLQELDNLCSKNRGLITAMMQKIRSDKDYFEQGLARFQALRDVFSGHANRLYTNLGLDALSEEWRRTRDEIRSSVFTPGVRGAMSRYFRNVRRNLDQSALEVAEIAQLMEAMYRKFSLEHGLRLSSPVQFSMLKYVKEIDRLESGYEHQFHTFMTMLTNEKLALMRKFFETLASQVKRCYEYANRETDAWLRALMAPMETQVHEHQLQLLRRLESIKHIQHATDTLARRVEELAAIEAAVREQLARHGRIEADIGSALEFSEPSFARAA